MSTTTPAFASYTGSFRTPYQKHISHMAFETEEHARRWVIQLASNYDDVKDVQVVAGTGPAQYAFNERGELVHLELVSGILQRINIINPLWSVLV
jgi:hypothetical protein